jgi:hypothetical protein
MENLYYRGFRDKDQNAHVVKGSGNDEQTLNCRWDLANHSPDGPEWGYGGSGPSQLALSLVADALGSTRAGEQLALGFYQDFKWRVIGGLEQELPWTMTRERVRLEIRDLVLDDLKNCSASCVTDARDRLVWLDLDARLNEAEQRGEDFDFAKLEAEQTRKVDEEFRKILERTLGLSSAVCDQLLNAETKVDQSQDEDESQQQAGGITI